MDIKKIIEEKCNIVINGIDLIGEGYDSKAYRVNNEFVFKIKFSANKKKDYEKEMAIYDFLNKKLNTNINIPNIEYSYISDEISILGYKEVKGTFLIPEIYYSLSREKQELLKKDIAMFLRQMHDLDYSEIVSYTIDNKQNVLEEYQLLKETIYDSFKDFEKQYIEDFMKRLHSTTIFDGKKCLCHNDFSCNNLLLDNDNRLTGVIDFGDSGIIDEYCDFIYLLEDSEEEIGSSFGEDILKLYGNIDIEKAKEYQDVVEQYYPIETIVYGIKNNKSDFVEKGRKEIYIRTHKEGNLTEEIFEMYKRNFPYINREEKTIKEIVDNENNIFFERRNDTGELIACAIVNKNTILLLVVDKEYRNQGLGKSLLKECENNIIKNGFDRIVLGVGFDYLMPGVPTSKKYTTSVHENLDPLVNSIASSFFEKRGYSHSWGKCNCFDMKMKLSDFNQNDNSIGDIINNVYYRWSTIDDLAEIIECADDACQFQDEKFSEYYKNIDLYNENNNQRVLVAVKDNKIVGTLIVSIETEGKDLGCVGCTCVSFKESHQKIGTTMVKLGTKYLKDIGLKNASLSYTYSGLDVLYGASGYEISTYYFMGEKNLEENK